MSKTDLVNYINSKFLLKLDENKIYNYQAFIDEKIDLNKMVDDIYDELLQKPTNETLLIKVLDGLDELNYPYATFILAQYLLLNKDKTYHNIKRVKQYLLKAISLNHPGAMYLYYKYYKKFVRDLHRPVSLRLEYLLNSAKLKYPEALTELGLLYLNGQYDIKQDAEMALKCFEEACKQNYAKAYFLAADTYETCLLIKTDYDKAIEYYKKVIEINDPKNMNCIVQSYERLGNIYENGFQGIKDIDEAIKYYTLGALNSSACCSVRLAIIYFEGKGVKFDIDKVYKYSVKYVGSMEHPSEDIEYILIENDLAEVYYIHALLCMDGYIGRYKKWSEEKRKANYIYFLSKAAILEHKESQFILGREYYDGNFVEQNKELGKGYLAAASKNNHQEAQYLLSEILVNESKKLKSFNQEEEYLDEAISWLKKITINKYGKTENLLGTCYLRKYEIGRYSKKINKEYLDFAIYWFERSAIYNNVDSYINLGKVYYNSQYGVQDLQTSFDWFKKACLAGSGEAYFFVGMLYYTKRNYTKAIMGFQKAVEFNFTMLAYEKLGDMYQQGQGVEKDYNKAKEYYDLAIKDGMNIQYKLNELLSKMKK